MDTLFTLDMSAPDSIKVNFIKDVPSEEWANASFPTPDMAEQFCESKLREYRITMEVSGDTAPF